MTSSQKARALLASEALASRLVNKQKQTSMTGARQQFKLFTISKLTLHKQCKMSVCYSGNMHAAPCDSARL